MDKILEEILKERRTLLPSGEYVPVSIHTNPSCGALLQKIIKDLRPKVALEVGLGFGISTLYMLEALYEVGSQKLIGMDPFQFDENWRGGGLHNIHRSGYEFLYEFHENTSQQVLPKLVGEGLHIDFAFIDGWHTFDHTLIDFFYIDQLLNIGGIVVFDDVGYPAIRRVCEFIMVNRDYEIYDALKLEKKKSLSYSMKRYLKDLLTPLGRTDKTPNSQSKEKLSKLNDVYFLALRKKSHDSRRWDHFVHF